MDRQSRLASYLRESRQPQQPVEEAKDPNDVAVRMLQNPKRPLDLIRKRLSALEKAFKARAQELEGLKKLGSANISAPDLLGRIEAEELYDLGVAVKDMEYGVSQVLSAARRSRG